MQGDSRKHHPSFPTPELPKYGAHLPPPGNAGVLECKAPGLQGFFWGP